MSEALDQMERALREAVSNLAKCTEGEHERRWTDAVESVNAYATQAAEELTAERKRREGLQRHYDAAGPDHNLLALLDLCEERRTQAERERDEARHAVLARFNEATEERRSRERAEADNAALLEAYRRTWGCVQHDNVVHSPACNATGNGSGDCTPECPARAVSELLASSHPGAAMLERMRALEGLAAAVRDYLSPEPKREHNLFPVRNALAAVDALTVPHE
jgi:hypothetical protein